MKKQSLGPKDPQPRANMPAIQVPILWIFMQTIEQFTVIFPGLMRDGVE